MYGRTYDVLPVERIHAFWDEVEEHLTAQYGLQGEQSVRAILRYRNEIDRVGSIVYHREPRDVADDIVSGEFVTSDRGSG